MFCGQVHTNKFYKHTHFESKGALKIISELICLGISKANYTNLWSQQGLKWLQIYNVYLGWKWDVVWGLGRFDLRASLRQNWLTKYAQVKEDTHFLLSYASGATGGMCGMCAGICDTRRRPAGKRFVWASQSQYLLFQILSSIAWQL